MNETLETKATHRRTAVQPALVAVRPVSVVIPLHNETECLPRLLEQLDELASHNRGVYEFEFLFVDDGSTDGTRQMLEEVLVDRDSCRVLDHEENRGIAAAIQTGIRAALCETVASIDADGSYDLKQLETMIPMLRDDVDMVTASPYHPMGAVQNVPGWRLWISKRASACYRAVMTHKLHCSTSCFRVYRRSRVADLSLRHEGFVGVAELAWRLDRGGSRIVEHPAVLQSRVAGRSKMRVARATLQHLNFLSKAMLMRVARVSQNK